MEFHFDVNPVLPDDITVVDSKLQPFRANHVREKGTDILKKHLEEVIDRMGVASSKAQGLKATITSSGKLSVSDHRLYFLKDSIANNGKGAVIGLIKVGKKRLFVIDIYSQQLEVNPLCILDFYVHEKCQRSGYGYQLFNFMLEREGVKPQFLAYDRPSSKFISFLKKHFDLQNAINQMNKFVVFDVFFRDLSAVGYVPRNKRFVSSAPSDSRMHSIPDSRLVSSASAFGRMRSEALQELQINDKSSTCYTTTLPSTGSRFSSLPPQPPYQKSSYQKETPWFRRNASHIQFTSTFSENASGNQPPDHRKNQYSRHAYLGQSNIQISTPQKVGNDRSQGRSDAALSVYGKNEETKKQISPASSNAGVIKIKPSESDITSQSQPTRSHSYSVDKLYRQAIFSQDVTHGTSWNLFGVPANVTRYNKSSSRNRKNQSGLFK